ncbi:MAG TPA: putative Ig domain-containing protein [Candidatus Binatia bacterium]|nr:putative Ig domain-containing protein [Candidatus Binatia bacterium]
MKLAKWLYGLAALAVLACFGATPALAQYMYMDTNGDGVWSTADVLNPNGTPTSVDVYLNTTHNRDGSVATCDSQDGNLAIWNSFATHISVPGGTVTFSNYTNQQAAFTINCSNGGLAFTSTATDAAQCQATGTPVDNGGTTQKLYTMTVTGVSGTPSLQFVPTNTLDNNPTSFGTNCGGNDFDNTYKLGTDWFDVNGAGPAAGGNALPILSVATTASGTEGQPFTITATATDTDGADVLTITATGYPSSLTLTTTPATHTATATLSGTLGLDDQGDHTITWSVSDGTNPPVTATTVLTVTNLDQAPVVTAPANVSGAVGTPITVTVTANDPDGDIIANLTAAPLPVGAEFTTNTGNTAGTLTWTPVAGQEGSTNVIFTASNSLFGSATTVFTIAGSGADVPPTVTAPTSVIGSEGTLVTFTVTAADPDGDAITSLTGSPLPTGATFTANATNTEGTFNWTPTFDQAGTYTVTWTASNALTGTASTAITIENTDQPPVLAPIGNVTVAEGSSATVNVVATDVDGDLITLDTTLPTFAVLNAPTSGTGTVSTTITLSPTTGSAGSYTGTVRATSGSFTDSTSFTITVTAGGSDQAPIVTAPATMSGTEGTLVTFTVSAADPDGQAITSLTASPLPTGATFTANAANTSGTFSWTPATGQAGTYDVTFTASNALTGSATTHLTITAPTVDQAPVVTAPANESGTEGTLLTFTVTASDPDGQLITSLTASPLPAGATFTANALNTSGTFNWTPSTGQAGTYDVTFTATNALSGTATTHVTITAPGVDQAPVVTAPANESGTEGTLLTFTVTANDPDGDAITSLTAAPLPSGATFTANASNTSGTFSWTPASGQAGTYDVTFTASNALSGSATTHLTISAQAADQAPVVTAPANESGTEGTLLTFTVTASDPDGDAITSLTASPLPSGATFTANASNTSGTFNWTPSSGQAGTYDVTFTASNALSGSATTHITISAQGANQAPVVTAPATQTVNEGQLLTFTVTATDADGDHVTLTASNVPSGATFTDNGNNTGTFSWTPNSTQSGTYTVTFTGDDGHGGTGTATTVITVNDVTGGTFTATLKLVGNFNPHRRFLCFHVTATGNSFDLGTTDLSSLVLNYNGATLPALGPQTHLESSCDEEVCEDCGTSGESDTTNCTTQLHVCFLASDVATLLGGNIPDNLSAITITGNLTGGGTFTATMGTFRVAGKGADKVNGRFKSKAKPNPLNPKTDLTFSLPTASHVRVSVFDARGRLVKTLLDGNRPAGENVVPWDGTDDRGGHVSSGVFFFRLEALGSKEMVRVTVLK